MEKLEQLATFPVSEMADEGGLEYSPTESLLYAGFIVAVILGLYLSSLYNYLLFHNLVEIATIAIGFTLFILAWNCRRFLSNDGLKIVGIGYAFIAFIDLLHALAYKGMNVFPAYGANLPTQLWIAARYLQAVTLVAAPLFIDRKINKYLLLSLYLMVVAVLVASIYSGLFPDCFIEGRGLTSFKIASEYLVTALLLLALWFFYRARSRFDARIFRLIIVSIVCTALSEIFFTTYLSVYGFTNMLGHLLKLAAYYLFYQALLVTGFKKPYELIFRDLVQAERALRKAYDTLEEKVRERTAELAASEKFLNNIVDNIPDMIFVKDAEELRFMRLNRAGEELLGCSRQEMLGKSDYDFFPKEEADFFVATDRQVLERKKMVDIPEETIKTRDLGERLLHTKKIPVLDSEGKPQYLLGISEDITERRQAEEALRKSEAFIKSILQSVDEGFIVIDRDFRIRSANQAYIDICGADVPDLTGRHCYEVCYHADRPCYELGEECPARQVFLSGETKQALHRPGGRMSKPVDYLEVRAYPMRDEAGQFDSVIEILVDVSEKMKLERQLRQAQKMEAIGTLAGGIAHDFNNILSCIIGYGEMVLEGLPPDSPLRDDQAQVLKGGERAVELVKQILAFSRGSEQESRPLLIQFVVKEDLKLLRASIPATIEIRTEIDPGCPAVLADPGRIHQVIMNLGTNAYHAMRETGGVIRFSMRETALPENHLATGVNLPAGRYLELEMSDSGRGIDRDILRRIFEPYFTTKPKGEGTGLGLAIVHGIVTGMGGGIEVDSTPGCGTTFKIYLPVFAGSAAAAGERFRPAMVARGRETIMVLDDEAGIVKLHGKVLEGLGYRVQCFVDCDEALLAFRQNPEGIDLALLDMTMPKRTGVQLAAELLGIRADLPIILCTGFSELINEEQAKTLGIREFLQKPVAKADLAAAVRRALDSPEPGCDELAITTDSPRRPRRTQS